MASLSLVPPLDADEYDFDLPLSNLSAVKHNRYAPVFQAILTRIPGESIDSVASRAGCSAKTIRNYMKDPDFVEELKRLTDAFLLEHRGPVFQAIVDGAVTPGKNQVALITLYLRLTGDLDPSTMSLADGRPEPAEFERLSPDLQRQIIEQLEKASTSTLTIEAESVSKD